jgi:hypothetical protein
LVGALGRGRTAQLLRLAVALGLLAVPVECARVAHPHSLFQTPGLASGANTDAHPHPGASLVSLATDAAPETPDPAAVAAPGHDPHTGHHGHLQAPEQRPAAEAANAGGQTPARPHAERPAGTEPTSAFWSPTETLALSIGDGAAALPDELLVGGPKTSANAPASPANAPAFAAIGATGLPDARLAIRDADGDAPAGVPVAALTGLPPAVSSVAAVPTWSSTAVVPAKVGSDLPALKQMTTAAEFAAGTAAATLLVAALLLVVEARHRAPLREVPTLLSRVVDVLIPPPRPVLLGA